MNWNVIVDIAIITGLSLMSYYLLSISDFLKEIVKENRRVADALEKIAVQSKLGK